MVKAGRVASGCGGLGSVSFVAACCAANGRGGQVASGSDKQRSVSEWRSWLGSVSLGRLVSVRLGGLGKSGPDMDGRGELGLGGRGRKSRGNTTQGGDGPG